MTKRKSRKSRSKRGSRTHGGGSARNRRHSGHRGGKGRAGSHKHKWRQISTKEPHHFGKYGFKRPPQMQKDVNTINVGELDEYADELLNGGLAEKEDGEIVLDASELGVDKVLGGGKVTRPLRIRADKFSDSVRRKLEDAGGAAVSGES
ncbi:MAG: uL15m family ribosomal protein [Candidatus Hadarchaeota archaeon]